MNLPLSTFLYDLIRNRSEHLYVQAQASNPVSLEVGRNSSQRSFIVSGTERGEDEAHDNPWARSESICTTKEKSLGVNSSNPLMDSPSDLSYGAWTFL